MPLDQPDEHDPNHDPDHYRGELDEQGHYKLSNDETMPLGDHLEELRSRIVKMLIGVVIALVITVIFGFQIVGWLAQPLLHAQDITDVDEQRYLDHGAGAEGRWFGAALGCVTF